MFYETFLSPQVKRGTNFSNINGTIWDLKPSEIRKIQKNLKTTYNFKPVPSPSPQENKSPADSNKKMLKNRSWIPPAPHYSTPWKLEPASNISWIIASGNKFLLLT